MATEAKTYEARCARDAQQGNYGGRQYWDYLDESSRNLRDYYLKQNQPEKAQEMMEQTLSQSLQGNNGD